MEEFLNFMQNYAEQSRTNTFEDFDYCKKFTRDYALERMKTSNDTNELMVIYNMAAHYCNEDPAGIYYMINMVAGPNPRVSVRMHVLAKLLQEMGREQLQFDSVLQPLPGLD